MLILTGCNLLYIVPPKQSTLEFSIGAYKGKWYSQGFDAVGDKRYISFYSKGIPENFDADYLHLSLTEPVTAKVFSEKESEIEIFHSQSEESLKTLFNQEDSRTKIRINLKTWSKKPRGLIEGDIAAEFYDYNGEKHNMKGHFTAYQALGTINSYH